MTDPLLSSLCTICHVDAPKYTCPRDFVQTCSLKCLKKHKNWASCNGVRDPTVFMPISQLATPVGIDHDYNFLHSIEHRIERAEKVIVEEKGLVGKQELIDARNSRDGLPKRPGIKLYASGEECVEEMLRQMGTRVHKAPRGMSRNLENKTSWSFNNKAIKFQVEWIRPGKTPERVLNQIVGNKSIEWHYDQWRGREQRETIPHELKQMNKKRKAMESREERAKRAKVLQHHTSDFTAPSRLQNPETGAWSLRPKPMPGPNITQAWTTSYQRTYNHDLFLHRPLTQSCYPTVLAPIDPRLSMTDILRKRNVVEFPSVYVFEEKGQSMSKEFMLESDYDKATGEKTPENSSTQPSVETEDDGDDDTSESDETEDVEEGEVVK